MDKRLFMKLPREILLNCFPHVISIRWNDLPDKWKNDQEFKMCLPCHMHDIISPGSDQGDGPPPMKKNCHYCINLLHV